MAVFPAESGYRSFAFHWFQNGRTGASSSGGLCEVLRVHPAGLMKSKVPIQSFLPNLIPSHNARWPSSDASDEFDNDQYDYRADRGGQNGTDNAAAQADT